MAGQRPSFEKRQQDHDIDTRHCYREIRHFLGETAQTIAALASRLKSVEPACDEMLQRLLANPGNPRTDLAAFKSRLGQLRQRIGQLVHQVDGAIEGLSDSLSAIRGMINCVFGNKVRCDLRVKLEHHLTQIALELKELRRGRLISASLLGQIDDLLL